jgi:hypothetical protein
MSRAEDYTLPADGALAGLVSQFRDRLACFRELVQNAIDAGSRRVEVWLEHEPGAGGLGTTVVHVRDDGEGMTAEIIDHQLTRLFASTKEGDRAKIGKFGIGFVSIFALEPRAVLLHTGRMGEAWEVIFHPDHSFTREPLPGACQGTHVRLFLELDAQAHAELARGARAALWRWCRFAEVDLRFQDRAQGPGEPERIQSPFEVLGDCPIRLSRPGLEMCLAFQAQPTYGFYNRGLMLLETEDAQEALGDRAGEFARIGFRVRADVLEHTLSRETIYRDAELTRVVEELARAGGGPLVERLVEEMEALAALAAPGPAELGRLARLSGHLGSLEARLLLAAGDRKVLATHGSGPRSLAGAWQAALAGELAICPESSAVVDALRAQGGFCLREAVPGTTEPEAPVRALVFRFITLRERTSLVGVLSHLTGLDLRADVRRPETWLGYQPDERLGACLQDPHRVFLAVEPVEPDHPLEALLLAAGALLERAGLGARRLLACRLLRPDPAAPLFVHGPRLAPLMRRAPPGAVQSAGCSVLNVEHPHARLCIDLQARSPSLAAFSLARALALETGSRPEAFELLLGAAREPGASSGPEA